MSTSAPDILARADAAIAGCVEACAQARETLGPDPRQTLAGHQAEVNAHSLAMARPFLHKVGQLRSNGLSSRSDPLPWRGGGGQIDAAGDFAGAIVRVWVVPAVPVPGEGARLLGTMEAAGTLAWKDLEFAASLIITIEGGNAEKSSIKLEVFAVRGA